MPSVLAFQALSRRANTSILLWERTLRSSRTCGALTCFIGSTNLSVKQRIKSPSTLLTGRLPTFAELGHHRVMMRRASALVTTLVFLGAAAGTATYAVAHTRDSDATIDASVSREEVVELISRLNAAQSSGETKALCIRFSAVVSMCQDSLRDARKAGLRAPTGARIVKMSQLADGTWIVHLTDGHSTGSAQVLRNEPMSDVKLANAIWWNIQVVPIEGQSATSTPTR
jgi:hypothetical protein